MSEMENGSVRYTVKELLAEMNHKLDRLVEAIDSKATVQDVDELSARVSTLERKYWMAVGFLTCADIAIGAYLKYVIH